MDVTNKSCHHTIILIDSLNHRHGMKGRLSYGPCDASCGRLTFCLNVKKDTTEDHQVVPPALTSCSCSRVQCTWKTWKSVWNSVAWRSTSVVSLRWLCSWILENLVNKCHYSLFLKVKPLSAKYHHKMCDEGIRGGVHIFENLLSPFYLPYFFGKAGWCGILLMALNMAATARAWLYLLTMVC